MDGIPDNAELLETGARLPGKAGRRGAFVAYRDVLHVAPVARGLRISTRRGVLGLSRNALGGLGAPARLAEALRARILQLPDGAARVRRMEALDELVRGEHRVHVTHVLLAVCGLLFGLQLLAPRLTAAGALHLQLAAIEPWRMVTAHFLHEPFGEGWRALLSPHFILNGLGLWALGTLVERILGGTRTLLVVFAAGVGAVWGSLAAGYLMVIGASGLVMGLAGSLVVLELARSEQIPAPWRLPRRLLLGLLFVDLVLSSLLPGVAHAAHWGGVVAGALATWATTAHHPAVARGSGAWTTRLAAACTGLGLLGLVGLGWSMLAPDQASLWRASRLVEDPTAPPGLLNDEAWMIATSDHPDGALLAVAERMAERAVDATARGNPALLDTLAEIAFLRGRDDEAVALIEEAIALAPRESYFAEQRRRFLGERARDDRPPEPGGIPAPRRIPPGPPLPEHGLRV